MVVEKAVGLREARCFPEKRASVSRVSPEVVSAAVLPVVEQASLKVYGMLSVALRLGYRHFVVTSVTDGAP